MDKYEVIGLLGEGSFGRVYKAKQHCDGLFVALKVISKRGRSARELKGFRKECEIQRKLHHPNIIQMLDSFETENEIVVITEFANNELNSLLGKKGYLPEEKVQILVWDLVSALYYLHSNRVLHRDLKPQNILLDNNNRAKLCDFGFARNMSTGTHVLTSIKGTPLYMAPELIEEQPYDNKADLWSLGCIIYELLMGTPPFCTTSILHLIRLIRHEQIQWPNFLSEKCISFLKGLLQKNPAKRFNWDEILMHPFVKGKILPCNTVSKPLTKSLSENALERKEQQRKDHLSMKQLRNASPKLLNGTDIQNATSCEKQSTSKDNNTLDNLKNRSSDSNKSFSQEKKSTNSSNNELKNSANNNVKSSDQKNNFVDKKEACEVDNKISEDLKNKLRLSDKSVENVCKTEKLNFTEENHPIETEEWIVFLQRSIQEVMNGEMLSLTQSSVTNVIVSPLRNINASSKVISFSVRLLSIPFSLCDISEETLNDIQQVYLDVKVIPNLVYASKLIFREAKDDSVSINSSSSSPLQTCLESFRKFEDLSDDDLQALYYIYMLITYLVHLDEKFLMQFCDAVVVLNMYCIFKSLFLLVKRKAAIVMDLLAILTTIVRKFPENVELIEKIVLHESNQADGKQICFMELLRHENPILRERTCYFLLFSCNCLQENSIKTFWNENIRDTLEALMFDSIESVRNAAEITVEQLKSRHFYSLITE